MSDEHRCLTCGTPLKLVTVQTPVWGIRLNAAGKLQRVIVGYQDVEDWSDCIRCHGAY